MKPLKINAFCLENGIGGNPAGVVLQSGLSNEEKQAIAKNIGLSETAFHSIDENGQHSLEFYTPVRKIDYCGHATVATFGALAKTLGDGELDVKMANTIQRVRILDGEVSLQQKLRSIKSLETTTITESQDSLGGAKIISSSLVNNGVRYFVLELESITKLKELNVNLDHINEISKRFELIGYYVYVKQSNGRIEARMFAPNYGISEESATGMAAGCLAAHLYEQEKPKLTNMRNIVFQGHLMKVPSPSMLKTEFFPELAEIWVSGRYSIIQN